MLTQLIAITNSRLKAQELFLLHTDVKSVVRQGYFPSELKPVLDWCAAYQVSHVASPFKILIKDKQNQFSDAGLRVPLTDPREGMQFVYFAKDVVRAAQALRAEAAQDHVALGKILEYPLCCTQFFARTFSEERSDLTHPRAHPLTRTDLRRMDAALVSHFPCSPACKESIALAQRYLDALSHHDPKYALLLRNRLS